ncbi:MAG: extracellular solute-binding protein [Clostridia bacterium]|nr:extracellular solute-binding protein [Clostridia bacterium]
MKRKATAFTLAALMAVSVFMPKTLVSADGAHLTEYFDEAYMVKENDYQSYLNRNGKTEPLNADNISVGAELFSVQNGAVSEMIEGRMAVNLTAADQSVSGTFSVTHAGWYEIGISYFASPDTIRDAEAALELDGVVPFSNMARMSFGHVWQDEGDIRTNKLNGNESAPRQRIKPCWQTVVLKSRDGEYRDAYRFYLTAGIHTVGLTLLEGNMAVDSIVFYPLQSLPTYQEYCAANTKESKVSKDFSKTYQAEKASAKSAQTFSPSSDRTSPNNVPNHVSQIRINVIGNNWSGCGDWIEWEIEAPEDGWYQLHFRYQQDANKGLASHRILKIDGTVPFDSAELLAFGYTESFVSYSLSDESGNKTPIYLTKGNHTMRLEVSAGKLSESVYALTNTLDELNTIYREIIMITGVNPDKYTDYDLDITVPNLKERLSDSAKALKSAYDMVQQISGGKGNQAELLNRFSKQLESFVKEIASMSLRLTEFKDNISALSTWLMDIRQQPLLLDSFTISAADVPSPYKKDSGFSKLWFEVKMFVASFFSEYDSFTTENRKENITLWLTSGRDQAQVIKTMIDDMFTPDTGIGVEIKLVSAGLTQAYLSGDCPDVSIMQGRAQPVNLGARGALLALDDLPGFEEITKRFQDTAMIPYQLNGKCYGLPDSQSFYMMFYRKDIFNELGLSVPQTWDELLFLSNVLQRNNMDIGLPYTSVDANASVDVGMASRNIFSALLLQNGGKFYADDLAQTALLSEQSQQAFRHWTDFYLLYDIPLTYNFYNRFRTGEMPLGIADYTMYNQLTSAALEIKGLWEMVQIPGTLQEDGTIDRSQGSTGSSCVIMKETKNVDASWKFLCWWTSTEAQTRYMQDIESVLGVTSRFPTSNMEAFVNGGWNRKEFNEIMAQWTQVEDIPEVVGSYYVVRDLDNAFREVILEGRNPREALTVWNRSINSEIKRKRKEFHYEVNE